MIKGWVHKQLDKVEAQYGYNVDYMRLILDTNGSAFFKFALFQTMSSHAVGLPTGVYFAAKIRSALVDDCGPCIQLVVNMALEAGVDEQVVADIVAGKVDALPEEVSLAVRFTDLVMAHNPEADELRDQIAAKWQQDGLITMGYAIAKSRLIFSRD